MKWLTVAYPDWCMCHCVCVRMSLQESFVRAQVWLKELEKQYSPESTVMWLVGNKADLDQKRQVSMQVQENNRITRSLALHIWKKAQGT